jgi:predicted enzyme related to lactoylglutathione lyase
MRPVHFEIHADDPERAIAFYRSVFDWKIERWGASEPPYWLVRTGEDGTPGIDGGLMKRMGPPPADMQPLNSHLNTIDVPDLENFTRKVGGAGGKQVVKRMPIKGVGWLAYFKDTEGNLFGLMQADPNAK